MLTEDEFIRLYEPQQAQDGNLFSWDEIKDLPAERVWTVVEGENDWWFASAGFHRVDVLGYLTSATPWTDEDLLAAWAEPAARFDLLDLLVVPHVAADIPSAGPGAAPAPTRVLALVRLTTEGSVLLIARSRDGETTVCPLDASMSEDTTLGSVLSGGEHECGECGPLESFVDAAFGDIDVEVWRWLAGPYLDAAHNAYRNAWVSASEGCRPSARHALAVRSAKSIDTIVPADFVSYDDAGLHGDI